MSDHLSGCTCEYISNRIVERHRLELGCPAGGVQSIAGKESPYLMILDPSGPDKSLPQKKLITPPAE